MADKTTSEGIDLPGVGTATDWASQLRSNWSDLSSFLFQGDASVLNADAINPPAVSTEGTINNRVQVGPGDDLATRITDAGAGGTLEFEPGTYTMDASPKSNQTWIVGSSVEFQPASDAAALNLTDVTGVSFQGTLKLTDSDGTTGAGTQILKLDGAQRCSFDRVWIQEPNVGIQTFSSNRNCELNEFESILIVDAANEYLKVNGETNDNQFGDVLIWGAGDGASGSGTDGIRWSTNNKDGGNVFDALSVIGVGGTGFSITDLNNELWVGAAILDANGADGIKFSPSSVSNRALSIESLWVGGNAGEGIHLDGTSTHPISGVQIGILRCEGNALKGARFEHLKDSFIGSIIAKNNDAGVRFDNAGNAGVVVGHVHTESNTVTGLDGPGVSDHVHIGKARVEDSATLTDFTTVGGTGEESASAETPTAGDFFTGDIVDFTDSDDGSGTGVYLKNINGNWTQLA